MIVAPKSLSDTEVGAFIRALFTVRPSLIREDANASKIQKPDTDKDAALPAHPGAAAYIDGTERTFLDKYSDYFWGAILVFSALGSIAAWMRHYLKRDERLLTTEHRDRLLAAITQVRKPIRSRNSTPCSTRPMTCCAKRWNATTTARSREGDLSAYGLVLEQFRHAMIDRRAAISAAGGVPRMAGQLDLHSYFTSPLWERSDHIVRCDPGEGLGSIDRLHPSPQPSPTRGEGAHCRC